MTISRPLGYVASLSVVFALLAAGVRVATPSVDLKPDRFLGLEPAGSPITDPSRVDAGREATRHGLRQGSPSWSLPAFLALPERVWGAPEARPGTERFARELFARYGLFPSDEPNDG